ncbi:MAG: thioredoxin [Selenomonadaceae bacterium]|nr:thioredoxin [Selenomonadaceae bacterium]
MNLKNFSSSRLIIFLASAAMIWFGIERGELSTIFAKATRVCLECIGLG